MNAAGEWRYVLTSAPGSAHIDSGIPCQDASRATTVAIPNGERILVAVASDGAGSAAHGGDGAVIACDSLVELAAASLTPSTSVGGLTRTDVEAWIGTIADRLREHAARVETPPREWACTLLAAIIGRDHAVYVQVGDGAIVSGADGYYRPVFWPVHGEYCNTTQFLTDERVHEAVLIEFRDDAIDEVSLFTDGLERLALSFSTREAHSPFFTALFGQLRHHPAGLVEPLLQPLRDWLCSPTVNSKTDDDKTLILATRRVVESQV